MGYIALRRTSANEMNYEQTTFGLPNAAEHVILGDPVPCHLKPNNSIWLLWQDGSITPDDLNRLITLNQNRSAFTSARLTQHHDVIAWLDERAPTYERDTSEAWANVFAAWPTTAYSGIVMAGDTPPDTLVPIDYARATPGKP